MSDFCAECGKPLVTLPHGAYQQCCNGAGYLSTAKPLDRDRWWPISQFGRLTFYPSAKWPMGRKPEKAQNNG